MSFFKDLFIICLRERESEHAQQQRGKTEGEAGFLLNKEPNAGLDSMTLGSGPEAEVDAQLTEQPRHLQDDFKTEKQLLDITDL